ncbi:MAG TPA: PQQ-binding-like beta-propeller repeat protein, partial [Verrucomicrobiaceae bacterium]
MRQIRLILCFAFCNLCFASPAADWPLARGDAAMTGRSPTRLFFPLTLEWSTEVGDKAKRDGVVATPIFQEGKVYVGAQNGRFACLDLETGRIIWQAERKGFFEGSAAVAGKLVIAGCGDAFVYAWTADAGVEQWKFETDGEIHAGVNLW